ncbi:MAG: hypothetical protein BMS9Abin08_0974 [Gammaproteobacteria bacterium]|nr:MAG: hypothetical protein BMS9Abin08_0974 [Gammaproteobacteria bacterium]
MKRLVLISILFSASPAVIADADRGKKLHDKYCTKCHGSEVYTRKDSFINSRAALGKQVKRCQLNVGAQWLDGDISDVVHYLNQSFYRFAE